MFKCTATPHELGNLNKKSDKTTITTYWLKRLWEYDLQRLKRKV